MYINIKLDNNIYDLINAFPERVEVASKRAVNRALAGINTDTVKIIRERYNIKSSQIRAGVNKFFAKGKTLQGKIEYGGKPILLKEFKPRPVKFTRKKPAAGISFEIRKGKKTLYKGSFFDRKGNIYKRVGKERLPIKTLKGPRLYQMVDSASRVKIRDAAEVRLLKAFIHEMQQGAMYS